MYSTEQPGNLTCNLNDQRKKSLFCDAVIEGAGGQKFPVHRNVIAAAAPNISSLFTWSPIVRLPYVDGKVLETLLEYIYTGKITLNFSDRETSDLVTSKFNETAQLFGLKMGQCDTSHVQMICKPTMNDNVIVLDDIENNAIQTNVADGQTELNEIMVPTNELGENEMTFEITASDDTVRIELNDNVILLEDDVENDATQTRLADDHKELNEIMAPINKLGQNEIISEITASNDAVRIQPKDMRKTRVTDKKLYKCQFCEAGFTLIASLKTHLKDHTGTPYKCQHCEQSFSESHNLKRHLTIHTAEKPYKCEHCDKSFSLMEYMKKHLRVHTGEKPYKCKHCEKSFKVRSHLNGHLRIHSGEKPYKCQHCEKSFAQSQNLKSHMAIHTTEKR